MLRSLPFPPHAAEFWHRSEWGGRMLASLDSAGDGAEQQAPLPSTKFANRSQGRNAGHVGSLRPGKVLPLESLVAL